MTAVEWLEKQLIDAPYIHFGDLFEQAKEMEKQQIIDAAERWKGTDFAEKYYAETYGSKGSDEYPEIEGTINLCNDITKKKTGKMTEEEWQAAERAQTSSQTEISDEEIEKASIGNATFAPSFINGAKWYREQLKNKQ